MNVEIGTEAGNFQGIFVSNFRYCVFAVRRETTVFVHVV
jgi:hypothetical protein